ncbi:MAG: tetratricopeptide repeat protein, partial [Myxococcaceae bacterium]
FAATGKVDAANVWQRAAAVLDTYAQGWVAMHTDTCQATRVRGEQSDEVLSLRMQCLDWRLHSLSALTSVYAQADAEMVDQAVKAAHALPRLKACADVQALRAPVPPPEDAATREKVEALRQRLAETQALFDAAKYKLAVEKARALTKDAAALGYAPLHAEALELHGALEERVGDLKVAEATLKQAVWAAEAGRHDEVAASAAARIVRVAYVQGDHARAREWAEVPRAKVARLGGHARIESSLLNSMGAMSLSESNGPEALAHFERALALRQKELPPDHPEIAAALNSVGVALLAMERLPEARQRLEQALAIEEKIFGPHHLETGKTLANLGHLASDSADDEGALRLYQRALFAFEAALGPERPEVADALDWIATVLNLMGRFEEALEHRDRVLALRRKIYGPEHMQVASALNNRGLDLQMLGKLEDALAHFRDALAMKERLVGSSSPQLGSGYLNIGEVLLSLERPAEARSSFERALALWKQDSGEEHSDIAAALEGLGRSYLEEGQAQRALGRFEQALAIWEKLGMPEHPELVAPLSGLGKVRLALHAPQAALEPLERALKLIEHPSVRPATRAEVRFLLAQALRDTRGDTARAMSLAQRAREELVEAREPRILARVESWLRAQGDEHP